MDTIPLTKKCASHITGEFDPALCVICQKTTEIPPITSPDGRSTLLKAAQIGKDKEGVSYNVRTKRMDQCIITCPMSVIKHTLCPKR